MSNEQSKIEEVKPKPQEELKEHEPDLKEFGHLFFLSYKFSQGETSAQEKIFKYLKLKHPEWLITPSFANKLSRFVEPMFSAYWRKARGKTHADKPKEGRAFSAYEDILRQVTIETDHLNNVWQLPVTQDLLESLVENLIEKDLKWLSNPTGRNKTPSERYHPDRDPFLSHVIYYGFFGNDTGNREYNNMFKEITELIRERYGSRKKDLSLWTTYLQRVVRIWNEKHPDQQIDLERELGVEV